MQRVYVVDTDWLLAWMNVPGFERAGPDAEPITHEVAKAQWEAANQEKGQFILTYAVIIEAGNHIAKARHSRREHAMAFTSLIRDTLDVNDPWAAFDETPDAQSLRALLEEIEKNWPAQAEADVSVGDFAIRYAVDYYQRVLRSVRILTGDGRLRAYESHQTTPKSWSLPQPRRRS